VRRSREEGYLQQRHAENLINYLFARHSRCATLALTDNEETSVERFLSYDVVPDLHRLGSWTQS
jgi:hypothetical protein